MRPRYRLTQARFDLLIGTPGTVYWAVVDNRHDTAAPYTSREAAERATNALNARTIDRGVGWIDTWTEVTA